MHIVYLLLEITLFRGPSSLLQVWAQFACPRPVFCVLPMSLTWDTFRITSHAWLVLWNDSFFIACDIFHHFLSVFLMFVHATWILSYLVPFPPVPWVTRVFTPQWRGDPITRDKGLLLWNIPPTLYYSISATYMWHVWNKG